MSPLPAARTLFSALIRSWKFLLNDFSWKISAFKVLHAKAFWSGWLFSLLCLSKRRVSGLDGCLEWQVALQTQQGKQSLESGVAPGYTRQQMTQILMGRGNLSGNNVYLWRFFQLNWRFTGAKLQSLKLTPNHGLSDNKETCTHSLLQWGGSCQKTSTCCGLDSVRCWAEAGSGPARRLNDI